MSGIVSPVSSSLHQDTHAATRKRPRNNSNNQKDVVINLSKENDGNVRYVNNDARSRKRARNNANAALRREQDAAYAVAERVNRERLAQRRRNMYSAAYPPALANNSAPPFSREELRKKRVAYYTNGTQVALPAITASATAAAVAPPAADAPLHAPSFVRAARVMALNSQPKTERNMRPGHAGGRRRVSRRRREKYW